MAGDEDACPKCNKKFTGRDYSIQCKNQCGKWFHKKCSGLDSEQLKRCEKGKDTYVCEECVAKTQSEVTNIANLSKENLNMKDIARMIQDLVVTVKKLEDENRQLKARIDDLDIKVDNTNKQLKQTVEKQVMPNGGKHSSYAEATSTKRKMQEILIIQSKEESEIKESDNLIEIVKKKVDPANLQIGVNNIRGISKGRMMVHCETKTDLQKLQREVEDKLGNQVKVTIPRERKPQLKIIGIKDNLKEEELIESIVKQNDLIDEQNNGIKIVHMFKRQYDRCAIVEVDGNMFNKIISRGKLRIMWSLCPVFENVSVLRCYKCNGYFHKAGNCRNKTTCGKCGDEHETKNCVSSTKKCINCVVMNERLHLQLDVNHTVYSQECQVLKKKQEQLRNRVEYEEEETRT